MIWHIIKRELYDNMNSLRFALTTLLLPTLMSVNAMVYLREYPAQIAAYRKNVAESLDRLKSQRDNLYNLIWHGPGDLYKQPSSLAFCAHGGEAFLPGQAIGHGHFWSVENVKSIWRMTDSPGNPNLRDIRPDFIKMDWAFVITVVLSFVTIVFTFDAISGEREQGTLRLMLSNSLPRDTVLLGKFLGTVISIGLPFLIALLINLFLLYASGSVPLGPSEWGRLGVILLIGLIYISIFIALGLLVSSRASQSSVSLIILLLIWAVLVVLTPSTLGAIASGLKPTQTSEEFRSRIDRQSKELWEQYQARGLWNGFPKREIPATKQTLLWAEFVTEDARSHEKLNEEHLKAQIDQIQLTTSITRLSPASIARYAIESLAGTGFLHHLHFLEQVRRYAAQFREFIIETDRADPDSPHMIGVREGMSEKPVPFEAIPKFEDHVSFRGSLNDAIADILLLLLFLVVLFASAYLSFLRVDVT